MKEIKYTVLYCVCENFCDSILLRFRGSGTGTLINYGSGSDILARYGSGSSSGSASQNVTVSTVPVPQRCVQAGGAGRPCRQRPDPRGSRHSAARLNTQIYTRPLGFILLIDCR
jgi:hypothetical protein